MKNTTQNKPNYRLLPESRTYLVLKRAQKLLAVAIRWANLCFVFSRIERLVILDGTPTNKLDSRCMLQLAHPPIALHYAIGHVNNRKWKCWPPSKHFNSEPAKFADLGGAASNGTFTRRQIQPPCEVYSNCLAIHCKDTRITTFHRQRIKARNQQCFSETEREPKDVHW